MFHSRILVASSVLALVPACASTVLPQQQLMDTQGAITSAEELKGDENPDAKLHLQFAREQLTAAKELMANGDDEEAERMLDRATADAELALTLARTEQLRAESREARSDVNELRTEGAAAGTPATSATTTASSK
jgi:hypothetical protein